MGDAEIYENILQIIKEHESNPKGISKTELTRIYTKRYGTSKTTIWEYIFDLINSNKIMLKNITEKQQTLFISK
jgi:hypothetical protein